MAPKNGKLVLEVLENNTLDRDRGGRDGGGPKEASEDTKHKATQAAQPIAATPWTPTLL